MSNRTVFLVALCLPGLLGCDQAQVVAVCDVWKANRDQGKNKVDGHYGNNDCEAYVDYPERLLTVSENHEHHFIECVKSRGTTVDPIDDAVRSDSIGHLSEIAVRTGRKITWDPVKEKIIGDLDAERYLSRTMRDPFGI